MSPFLMEHGDRKAKANDKGLKNVFRWLWVDEGVGYTDKDGHPQTKSQGCFIQMCINRLSFYRDKKRLFLKIWFYSVRQERTRSK